MGSNKKQIYIQLIDGTSVLVPVLAIRKDDNIFEILENKYLDLESDATSIWEFFPGDTIKCELKDNEFIAKEFLSSNFPNRKLHQLIFIIVEKMGNVPLKDLENYSDEIRQLITDTNIIQKNHPVIQSWIKKIKI